ncbi:MAG: ADP-dependent (S)-NAD(P)H-hydrate dehydratase [Microgenomates group bacterium Gr01-1014_16]|nr:MAG: ADP-dependent (S)-NAD(P)H-hydrate dehydratase [Microgenomates group bacterium Gr01-1014_16]
MNDYRMTTFEADDLKKLWKPREDSSGEDNGQVTIIGGSGLFHGAPMLAVKAASRIVDMVFFGSPERELEKVSKLNSFIWIPWEEVDQYIAKSDAVLIGPGFMRFRAEGEQSEKCDEECRKTREITKNLLVKFPEKKWVIDGGSLQVMDTEWVPKNAVLTPNKKEFELMFNVQYSMSNIELLANKFKCIIVYKGSTAYVSDGETTYEISGGNAGLTKGGTGDILAGIIVGLLAKNPPLLAAAAGTYLIKKTAETLFEKVGYNFNADDVAEAVFGVFREQLVL